MTGRRASTTPLRRWRLHLLQLALQARREYAELGDFETAYRVHRIAAWLTRPDDDCPCSYCTRSRGGAAR